MIPRMKMTIVATRRRPDKMAVTRPMIRTGFLGERRSENKEVNRLAVEEMRVMMRPKR